MLLEKYNELRQWIIDSNKYPSEKLDLKDIITDLFYKNFDKTKLYDREIKHLITRKNKEDGIEDIYIVILTTYDSSEYIVFTITHIYGKYDKPFDKFGYNYYKFNILDMNVKDFE